MIGNAPVHITYTFSGHFHGQNSSEQRAGRRQLVREDVSYDGTSTAARPDDPYWSATCRHQGNQTALGAARGQLSAA